MYLSKNAIELYILNILSFAYRYANTPLFGAQYLPPLSRPQLFGAPFYATSHAHFHSLFASLTAPEPPRLSPDDTRLLIENSRLSPENSRLVSENSHHTSEMARSINLLSE